MLLFYIALHERAPFIPPRDRELNVHIRLYAQAGIAAPGVIVTTDISQALVRITKKRTEGIIFNTSAPLYTGHCPGKHDNGTIGRR